VIEVFLKTSTDTKKTLGLAQKVSRLNHSGKSQVQRREGNDIGYQGRQTTTQDPPTFQ